MRARSYALTFMTAAVGLFIAVVALNVTIDTEGVFGTGVLGPPLNPNARYQRFVEYQAASDRYDGLLFGSSRALDLPRSDLQRMKGVTFADFAVQFGLVTDHLPILEYVLREKAAKRQRLRAVFLLLDADGLGAAPRTNRFLQTMQAPAVTGEQPLRFWWRYLTAIQIGTWRGELARAWKGTRPGEGPQGAATDPDAGAFAVPGPQLERISRRPDYARQLRLLRQFVELCRRNGVALHVAISPLSNADAAKYDPTELAKVVEDVSRIVPVWDFTASHWLAGHPELWSDSRHFAQAVGRLMLARMFGDAAVTIPDDFGRLKTLAP